MNIEHITVKEYMQLQLIVKQYKDNENEMTKQLIKFVAGSTQIKKTEADELLTKIHKVINDEPDFIQRFQFNGVEYGFIPNLNDMTVGEYIDLDTYMKEGTQLHKIAAILYRPVSYSYKKMYKIEDYEGTQKYSDVMMNVDYKVIAGAIVFFWNLGRDLLNLSHMYIDKEMKDLKQTMKKIEIK